MHRVRDGVLVAPVVAILTTNSGPDTKRTPPRSSSFILFMMQLKKLNKNVIKKILHMAAEDLKMRKKADRGLPFNKTLDRRNASELKKIISKHGWLSIPKVGKKASWGAWLIAQHSDHDIKFQKECLKLMEGEWLKDNNNVKGFNIAFLKDRVLINSGERQLYGSQFYINKKGNFVPKPIKDIKNLETRRKEYGLPPFEESLASAKQYKPQRV